MACLSVPPGPRPTSHQFRFVQCVLSGEQFVDLRARERVPESPGRVLRPAA
jgi:hypothetical protein